MSEIHAPWLAGLLAERDRLREAIGRLWDVYYAEFGDKKMSPRFTALLDAAHRDSAIVEPEG